MPRAQSTNFVVGFILLTLSTTGCGWGLTNLGPSLNFLAVPIPVSPYFQDLKEEEFWFKERYGRVPILGPITSGFYRLQN